MEITSLYFILFSIVAIFIFYLLNHKYRTLYLVILSCTFIAGFSYYLLIYVIVYSLINYYIGLKIPVSKNKKTLFRTGIIINLSQLIILKYLSFTIEPIFQLFNSNFHISKLSDIIIPIGISFFTLQGIGYLVNVKMAWEKPEKKFLNFLLYITFYPKFLSGPIERSDHFLPQLKVNKLFDEQQVGEGLRIALFGFFKKIVIANKLAPYLYSAFTDINSADGLSLWILFFLQPLYLYFDFSGYTDIVRGFAKTLGIELLPNFNRPFFSENMTTFWKRFHISLSSWFHDYVFIQTSYKYRKWGIFASIYALLLTWILFGIWHGGEWHFMILGLLQALALIYEFFTKKWRVRLFLQMPEYFRIWFGRIVTYFFFCVAMVFFFSPDINSAFIYFSKLSEISYPDLFTPLSVQPYLVIIYIIIFLLLELIKSDFRDTFNKLEYFWLGDKKRLFRWAIFSLMITLIIIGGSNVEKFVYVNF